MFKVSAPPPAALPSYLTNAQASTSASAGKAVNSMDLDDVDDEDPAMLSSTGQARVAVTGEPIANSTDFMRGHGTYANEEAVVASVSGIVERVNKLVSVRAVRAKYRPEVGDLVIGRITEVGPRRWRVDANGRLDAILMLSSINLPGGVQRRKLESDELQMRTFFQEGDLLVAEVQMLMSEGTMSLHTRSLKYGKLRNGVFVVVPPSLIMRLKSHFHTLPCGVDLILGMNGYIWVQAPSSQTSGSGDAGMNEDERGEASTSMAIYSSKNDAIAPETSAAIDRVAACIRILAANNLHITDANVIEAYEASRLARTRDGEEVETSRLSEESIQSDIVAAVIAARD